MHGDDVIAEPALETLSLKLRGAEVDEAGEFRGYASVYDIVDHYGDVIAKGAFRKSVSDNPRRPLLWGHHPLEPIGVAELSEDERGLKVYAKLALGTQRGKEAYELLRMKAIDGLSVGFVTKRDEPAGNGGRRITEAQLVEVSLTVAPANPKARVTQVKSKPAVAAEKAKEIEVEYSKEITQKFDEFGAKLAELGAKFDETRRQVDLIDGRLQSAALSPRGGGVRSLGEQVAAAFLEHKAAFDRHGRVAFDVKAITSAGLVAPAPAGVIGEDATGLGAYGGVRRRLRTLPAPSGAIYLIREADGSNWKASPAAETSTKHESQVTLSSETIPVETIATWISATKQSLDDIDGLQAFVNTRLVQAIEKELEEQILLGSGAPPNLHGLVTNATAWTVPSGWTYWNLYDLLLLAATQCRLNGFNASIAVLHPSDIAKIRLQKDQEGNYLAPPQGLPEIIPSPAMPEGQALVGDASQAALRIREDIGIEISTEHSDYFVRNMVAIRAEMRCALQITAPKAWLKFNLLASPA